MNDWFHIIQLFDWLVIWTILISVALVTHVQKINIDRNCSATWRRVDTEHSGHSYDSLFLLPVLCVPAYKLVDSAIFSLSSWAHGLWFGLRFLLFVLFFITLFTHIHTLTTPLMLPICTYACFVLSSINSWMACVCPSLEPGFDTIYLVR